MHLTEFLLLFFFDFDEQLVYFFRFCYSLFPSNFGDLFLDLGYLTTFTFDL